MGASWPNLRANVVIVFGGAFLVILVTKAFNYLLPQRYYFQFSQILASKGDPPLIVQQPGVTLKKLCDILKQNKLPTDVLGDRPIDCDRSTTEGLTRTQRDKLYEVALGSDQALRAVIAGSLGNFKPVPMTAEEVRELGEARSTFGAAYDDLLASYEDQVREAVSPALSAAVNARYGDVLRKDDDEPGQPLSADDVKRLLEANTELARSVVGTDLAKAVREIRKSAVDDILKNLDEQELVEQIVNYYLEGPFNLMRETTRRKLEASGVLVDQTQGRMKLFGEINRFSWLDYLVAILLRLTPVLLVGFTLGLLAGRGELFSIALAGGVAAFLLSWPLMLLWDTSVDPKWHDKRIWFLLLYATYALAFFFTARATALLGTWVREQRLTGVVSLQGPAGQKVLWREIAVNGAGAFGLTALAYAWNLVIPFAAASSP